MTLLLRRRRPDISRAAFLDIYPHRETRIFPGMEFGVALHDLLEFLSVGFQQVKHRQASIEMNQF